MFAPNDLGCFPRFAVHFSTVRRRDFLKQCAVAYLAGLGLGHAAAKSGSKLKCRPFICGTLWWCSPDQSRKWGSSGWREELQEQQDLGFDMLWLAHAPSLIGNEGFALRQLLDLCAERRVQVLVDTGLTARWYAPLDLKKELELCRNNIAAVGK